MTGVVAVTEPYAVQLSLADGESFGKYGKRDITDSGATFAGRRRRREHWFW
jgi:hypothetical protein